MVNSFFSRRALLLSIAILLAVSLLIGLAVSLHSTLFFPMGHHVTHLLADFSQVVPPPA